MSLKKKLTKQQSSLLSQANAALGDIRDRGNGITSDSVVGNLVSMESLASDVERATLANSFDHAESVLKNAFGLSVESFEDASIEDPEARKIEAARLYQVAMESGSVAVLATGNPLRYARSAMNVKAAAPSDGTLITPQNDGVAGSMGYQTNVSNEAYDEAELTKHQAQSIAFNTFAARQDAFGEAFFPTIVIPADPGGADLIVRRQRVHNEARHALTGKAADFGYRNLLSAAIDSTILADESTRLVPYRDPTVAAPENQLNTDQYGQVSVEVAGVAVPTAPLKFSKNIDLLGISGYAPLLGAGILDHTDAIAGRAGLSAVYLSGGVDGSDDLAVVAFNTKGLSRSSFVASTEGRDREMTLMFKFNDLIITGATRAVDGSTVPSFAAIASNNLTVHASVTVSGTLDTQTGNVSLTASAVQVNKITDVNGASISLTTGTGQTVKNAVEALPLVGYDLNAYRTNSNRRTAGKRLDIETVRERYTVLVGPPISVQRPATEDGEAAELEALVNAVRLRNSNNAVTALLNHADILRATVKGLGSANPEIAGMGRHLVDAFYEEHTLGMVQSLSSIKSHERAEDVSATLMQAIRDVAYRMYQYSGIQAALDAQNQTGSEQPVLLIGTDQTLVRHLMVQGDTRTFGTQFNDARVAVSQDARIRHKIFVTFGRSKGLDSLDPLRFGSHLWIPELVSRMPVSRNGATNMEAMVQPRNLHVAHLPVLAVITVKNLPLALIDKTEQPVIQTNVTNPYLAGIKFDSSAD